MGIIDTIFDAITGFINLVRGLVKTIVTAIVNFAKEVVGYFKNLRLNQRKDMPFLANSERFKGMIKNAPRKSVGIFEGVYDEEADEITNAQYISADQIDQKTREVLGNEELVVLS